MPRVPTTPLPELTTRGTKRKNRLYCPEEKVQKALELIRQGVFILRAARICDVPEKRLQARVRELRARGELDIFWGKNAPGYLAKVKQEEGGEIPEEQVPEEPVAEEVSPDGKKKKRKKKYSDPRYPDYTHEAVYAAANAVREGLYTENSAHHIFQVPRRMIRKVLNGQTLRGKPQGLAHESEFVKIMGKMGPNVDPNPDEKRNWRHFSVNKLSLEEEQLIVNYSLALYNLNHPVTLKSIFPLANRLLEERGQVVRDPHCWFKAFVVRHPELANKTFTTSEIYKMKPDYWIDQVLTRLTTVYDTHNFHVKPSRIYSWHSMNYNVERWEPEQTNYLNVDILVAANAVGYHILPPCVVYANDGSNDVPDFLGLPEAGFVASDETRQGKKILTPAILVEWFRSVFLQYLPSRSPDDPIALVLPGSYDWITPELVSLAEQNYVHLIPINSKVLEQLSPLLILLHQLKKSYLQTMINHRDENLLKQAKEPAEEAFFPVKFRKLFSSCFSMYNVQEAFKTTGIFPLNPERFKSEQPVSHKSENENPQGTMEELDPVAKARKEVKSGNRPANNSMIPRLIKYSDIDLSSEDRLVLKPSAKPKSKSVKPVSTTAGDNQHIPVKIIKTKSATKGNRKSPRKFVEILPLAEELSEPSPSSSRTATCIIRYKACVSTATTGVVTTTPCVATATGVSLESSTTRGNTDGSSSEMITSTSSTNQSQLGNKIIILEDSQIDKQSITPSGGSTRIKNAAAVSGNISQTVTTDASQKPILSIGTFDTGESSSKKLSQPLIIKSKALPKASSVTMPVSKPIETLQEGDKLNILSKAFGSEVLKDIMTVKQQSRQKTEEKTAPPAAYTTTTTTEEDGTVVITLTGMSDDIAEPQITLESPGTSSTESPVVLVWPETHDETDASTSVVTVESGTSSIEGTTESPKTTSISSSTKTSVASNSGDEKNMENTVYQNAQILSSLAQVVSKSLTKKPAQITSPPVLPFVVHQQISKTVSPVTTTINTDMMPLQASMPTLVMKPAQPAMQPVVLSTGLTQPAVQPVLKTGLTQPAVQQVVLSTGPTQPVVLSTGLTKPAAQPVVLSTGLTQPAAQPVVLSTGLNKPAAQPVVLSTSPTQSVLLSTGLTKPAAQPVVLSTNPTQQVVLSTNTTVPTMVVPAMGNNPTSAGSYDTTSSVAPGTSMDGSKQSEKQPNSSSDTQDPTPVVSEALESNVGKTVEESNPGSAESSDVSVQPIARKSPRKQTLVAKMSMDSESDRDLISADSDKSQDSSEESRKRKGSPLSSLETDKSGLEQSKKAKIAEKGGLAEQSMKSTSDETGSEQSKKTKIIVKDNSKQHSKMVQSPVNESGPSETRMTRAKSKEEASPSRRTRSMKN